MSLSKRSLTTLLDLVEIKLSCIEVMDREDAKEIKGYIVLFNPKFYEYLKHSGSSEAGDTLFHRCCVFGGGTLFEDGQLTVSFSSKISQFHGREFLTLQLCYENRNGYGSIKGL